MRQPNRNFTVRDYFQPRRRKVGVLALILACALMVEWVRSRIYTDVFRIQCNPDHLVIASLPNGLAWTRVINAQNIPTPSGLMTFLSADVWPSHPFTDESLNYSIQRNTWLGFLRFEATPTAMNPASNGFVMWYIPYAWPVSLLTALSTWLMFSDWLIAARQRSWFSWFAQKQVTGEQR